MKVTGQVLDGYDRRTVLPLAADQDIEEGQLIFRDGGGEEILGYGALDVGWSPNGKFCGIAAAPVNSMHAENGDLSVVVSDGCRVALQITGDPVPALCIGLTVIAEPGGTFLLDAGEDNPEGYANVGTTVYHKGSNVVVVDITPNA